LTLHLKQDLKMNKGTIKKIELGETSCMIDSSNAMIVSVGHENVSLAIQHQIRWVIEAGLNGPPFLELLETTACHSRHRRTCGAEIDGERLFVPCQDCCMKFGKCKNWL